MSCVDLLLLIVWWILPRYFNDMTYRVIHFFSNTHFNTDNKKLDNSLVQYVPNIVTNKKCPICLRSYEKNSNLLRILTCGHNFEQKCIDKWLILSNECPLCEKETVFDTGDLKSEQNSANATPKQSIPEIPLPAIARSPGNVSGPVLGANSAFNFVRSQIREPQASDIEPPPFPSGEAEITDIEIQQIPP